LSRSYERPTITDYGTIAEMTRASGFVNEEDGGSKLLIHHVSAPAG
jgi:hypothetical protein